MSLWSELKRRNVFRVAAAYAVVAWLLIEVADTIFPRLGLPDWTVTLVIALLILGFPLALALSWAYEITPEGVKKTDRVHPSESTAHRTGRKLNYVLIGVLVTALGWFAWDRFRPGPAVVGQSQAREASIAVLPFANRSKSEEDAFFVDGLHDDLLTQLSKIEALKVISRTSVMQYRDTNKNLRTIAEELGVAAIVEGGVQRAGDRVRVNVQLIDALSDEHLWAEGYDRELTTGNLFATQNEIAIAVARALQAELSPEEEKRIAAVPTQNLAAYEHYLKGRQLLAERTGDSIRAGHAELDRSVTLDPEFAPAVAELANALHLLNEYLGVPADETLAPAHGLIDRALAIDPELARAFAVRGEILRHELKFAASEAAFRKAIEFAPGDADTYLWFALLRNDEGRLEEWLALLSRAHDLNPLSRNIHASLGSALSDVGRDEEAFAVWRDVSERYPDYATPWTMTAWLYESRGDPVDALRAMRTAERLDPDNWDSVGICDFLVDLDALDLAKACLDGFLERHAGHPGAVLFSHYAALARGDLEAARTAVRVADALPDPESPNWLVVNWNQRVASAYVTLGELDAARRLLLAARPDWFTEPEPDVGENFQFAIAAAVTLFDSGDPDQARRLLQATAARMASGQRARGWYAFGNLDVAVYALLGERERALAALAEVAEMGYLTQWQLLKLAPYFESIREDPRFKRALVMLREKAAEQRERARQEGLLQGAAPAQ